jgi:hypothetical protein
VPAEQGGAGDMLSTFAEAQIRAAFYPKFENQNSEVRAWPVFPLSSGFFFYGFDHL